MHDALLTTWDMLVRISHTLSVMEASALALIYQGPVTSVTGREAKLAEAI